MRPGLSELVSFPPGSGAGVALGTLGHVSPPRYSFTTPGGCDALSAVFRRPPRYRADALYPGRRLEVHRGGVVAWSGILDEPAPGADGWQVTAHGAGGMGQDYRAVWTGTWGTGTPDNAVNAAIVRGLDWLNPGIGSPAGMWMGQQVDSGSVSIPDLLSTVCHKGGLTWSVVTGPRGNVLAVFALPTVTNRILVAVDAVPTSVTSAVDALAIRYQATADNGAKAATYGLTWSLTQPMIDASGRREDYMDISSAGVYTAGQAQGVGASVMKQFTRAKFTEPFTARYGDLLSAGGVPLDPGVFYADGLSAMVCKLVLGDVSYGGEVSPGALGSVLVGAYEWDDATCTATITPFESLRQDWASLLSVAAETVPVRSAPTTTKKKGK
jgi:hypothetical protein